MLALLLGCARAPSDAEVSAATLAGERPGEVLVYLEEVGRSRLEPLPIRGLTSLDVYVEHETLFVAGLSHELVPSAFAEWFPQLFVVVLESTDMQVWTAHAWPCLTMLRGKIVMQDGHLLGDLADGQWIPRKINPEIIAAPMKM